MSVQQIHENIFQHLMKARESDEKLYFLPRKVKDHRLQKGYWFVGTDDYISVTFWSGNDSENRTPNISFTVLPQKSKFINSRNGCTSFIQLTARDCSIKNKFLKDMSNKIDGVKLFKTGEWNKPYSSPFYLKNLDNFLLNDKPLIDDMIESNDIEGLSLLNEDSLIYIKNIETLRANQ